MLRRDFFGRAAVLRKNAMVGEGPSRSAGYEARKKAQMRIAGGAPCRPVVLLRCDRMLMIVGLEVFVHCDLNTFTKSEMRDSSVGTLHLSAEQPHVTHRAHTCWSL